MQTEKTGVVYRIYHKETMKSYVGKSIRPKKRIREHFHGYGSSPVLFNAIKKYGKNAFCVQILESSVPESHLSKLESLHIRFFNSKAPHGYNLTDGGEGVSGRQASPITRQKLSEALKGRKHSPEARQKLSEANKGKRLSPDTRQKMSEVRKGMTPWNKGKTNPYSEEAHRKMSQANKGKKFSPDHRRKISEAKKGRTHTPEARQKISESGKGRIPWNKGKTDVYSDETRRKMSEAHKRRTRSS